jgi:hypothetical protein
MKSRKIRRLEFVLDKIEGGDSKRGSYASVLVIPQRKMSFCEDLHGGGHGRSWSSINGGMGAHRRGEGEGEGKEGQGEARPREAARGAWRGGGTTPVRVLAILSVGESAVREVREDQRA